MSVIYGIPLGILMLLRFPPTYQVRGSRLVQGWDQILEAPNILSWLEDHAKGLKPQHITLVGDAYDLMEYYDDEDDDDYDDDHDQDDDDDDVRKQILI